MIDPILRYLAVNYPIPSQVVTRDHEVQFEELETQHIVPATTFTTRVKLVTVCYTDVLYYPWVQQTTFLEEPKKVLSGCVDTKNLIVMFQGKRPFVYIRYKIYDISDPSFNLDEVLQSIWRYMSKESA